MPFQAIESRRLYQHVASQVADLIRSGELPFGERLPPERDLAKRLGVSRPTIREAMVALEMAGLVEVRTGLGVFVRSAVETQQGSIAASRFDAGPGPFELLAARMLIEPEIAALAASSATMEDIDAIEHSIASLESAPDHQASLDADQQFHSHVAAGTQNSVLVSIVEALWRDIMSSAFFELFATRSGLPETRDPTIVEHREILRQIKSRSREGARKAMREHLRHVEAVLESSNAAKRFSRGARPA
jgi:DNA-binding FadR family transcriptional regulator